MLGAMAADQAKSFCLEMQELARFEGSEPQQLVGNTSTFQQLVASLSQGLGML